MPATIASSGLAHSLAEPFRIHLGLRLGSGVECAIAAIVYTLLSFLLLRFGYTPTLERLLQALPSPIAQPVRRLFFLRLG